MLVSFHLAEDKINYVYHDSLYYLPLNTVSICKILHNALYCTSPCTADALAHNPHMKTHDSVHSPVPIPVIKALWPWYLWPPQKPRVPSPFDSYKFSAESKGSLSTVCFSWFSLFSMPSKGHWTASRRLNVYSLNIHTMKPWYWDWAHPVRAMLLHFCKIEGSATQLLLQKYPAVSFWMFNTTLSEISGPCVIIIPSQWVYY